MIAHECAFLPAALRACARLQPNDPAFTYIDYEKDWAGLPESLTWSQLYRRTLNVARELSHCVPAGERAMILAPRGSITSPLFSARYRPELSRFRLRSHRAAPPMNALMRYYRTRRRVPFSRHPLLSTMSASTLRPSLVSPRPQSSKLIYSTWILRVDPVPATITTHRLRICNIPPGRPVPRRAS